MLAVVKSVRTWRPYLLSKTFTVRTDQKSLKYLLEQRITTSTQARWLSKLMGYDYKVEYKWGLDNKAADSLSRLDLSFISVSRPHADWWKQLQIKCGKDPYYTNIASASNAIQRDGVWFLKGKVLLNPFSPLVTLLLAECHSTPTAGHFGYHKTLSRLRSDFHWVGMQRYVKEFLRQCAVC